MDLPLTTSWICDSCGLPIESASHGWVEWMVRYEDGKQIGRNVRLVHHCSAHEPINSRCQHNENLESAKDGSQLNDLPLDQFLGANGLMDILSEIDRGTWPLEDGLKMIKRLHIPGYEHARFYFDEAIRAGVFEPNVHPDYFSQETIKIVLDWVAAGKPQ